MVQEQSGDKAVVARKQGGDGERGGAESSSLLPFQEKSVKATQEEFMTRKSA